MSRNGFQRKRKIFTWLFGAILGILIVLSRSTWEDAGLIGAVFFVAGLLLVGVATVGRLWCALYIGGYKTRTLITTGPYSVCRHPLYFFSLLGGVGIGLTTETLTVPALILAVFGVYYPFVIRAEERRLRDVHGDEYERYARTTPRFWPAFARLVEPREYTTRPGSFRKAVFDAVFFIWFVGGLELVKAFHEHNVIPTFFRLH